MQTFLPSPVFSESARALDRQRLGKQRVECLQILRALVGESRGWLSHPATRMWAGHEGQLVEYGLAICDEWVSRGYRDTCAAKIRDLDERYDLGAGRSSPPPWLGDPTLHESHRSNLARKAPEHYGRLWPDVPRDLPYVWPT